MPLDERIERILEKCSFIIEEGLDEDKLDYDKVIKAFRIATDLKKKKDA